MQISGAEKCFVGQQGGILAQESALLMNNAVFWGRKVLCGATMPISGCQKAFPLQEVHLHRIVGETVIFIPNIYPLNFKSIHYED